MLVRYRNCVVEPEIRIIRDISIKLYTETDREV